MFPIIIFEDNKACVSSSDHPGNHHKSSTPITVVKSWERKYDTLVVSHSLLEIIKETKEKKWRFESTLFSIEIWKWLCVFLVTLGGLDVPAWVPSDIKPFIIQYFILTYWLLIKCGCCWSRWSQRWSVAKPFFFLHYFCKTIFCIILLCGLFYYYYLYITIYFSSEDIVRVVSDYEDSSVATNENLVCATANNEFYN